MTGGTRQLERPAPPVLRAVSGGQTDALDPPVSGLRVRGRPPSGRAPPGSPGEDRVGCSSSSSPSTGSGSAASAAAFDRVTASGG